VSPSRTDVKRTLGRLSGRQPALGLTVLTYHRIGGGSGDELDVRLDDFAQQVAELAHHRVEHLDGALDALDSGDTKPRVVLTFDDGFADVYRNAWPLLRAFRLPFTVYVASSYIDGAMSWEGSTARDAGAPALTWGQLETMVDSGLCTVGNHTHSHVLPDRIDAGELDLCNDEVCERLGVVPEHFAFPWGVPVPRMVGELRTRFRSAVTGRVGRNLPDVDRLLLRRVPVRRSDPPAFFRAKLIGSLLPERTYGAMVATAKRVGAHA
jgi:peptidoglycan/xylan/chitin deacetylase (PgdA/CDA1 family)